VTTDTQQVPYPKMLCIKNSDHKYTD